MFLPEAPEGGGPACHVPAPLDEGGEAADTVTDEEVAELQKHQVHEKVILLGSGELHPREPVPELPQHVVTV